MRNRINVVVNLELGSVKPVLIINMLLCIFRNLSHVLNSLNRMFAGSRLAGQHDSGASVINGIGNIGDLRSGRTRILDHGL